MIHIIDKEAYANLLVQYQPKVIETELEKEAAIALAEELEHRGRTLEEDAFLDLLIILIENFEGEHYQLNAATPQSILLHLMETRDFKQVKLIDAIGSKEVVSEAIDGKRKVSKS
ncbi:transcriptional regulator [Chroococcidiopsis sp. FACHB-1243]|uniref:helix-turn-helix domain-containing protein n=1 Tax=Chroococcidiopsis sp. [FACHB-1243] TaxID=2692781 RepID=UPI00178127A0|nr:transcriptional regulator [Chroococcidiopsis sp. [FACHB-1243]]MBD2306753.1 transcriptional regulator [Chroococcidiopsis sp. [FACHB-1243]]